LLSRLSEQAPVLFLEEPFYEDGDAPARLDLTRPMPAVCRAVPILPATLRGRYDDSIATIRELLRRSLADDGALGGQFVAPIQWFYTPLPAPAMIGAFGERAVVYDCMDELSKFRFAPAELTEREAFLMERADVVFTGGYRLAQAKKRLHQNVHFFGCGVDVAHFATANSDHVAVPAEIAALGMPVAGYYGVIDERLDYPLIDALAARMPHVAIVMVGPVVKVDPRELPQRENIHWLGQRAYDQLPAHVKGFDVCLMPFALNEATEYINPTKTLEYMAAARPIVSTPVSDVVHNFTPVVTIADSADAFAAAVRTALESPDEAMIERGLEQAACNSWESIVAQMSRIVADAVQARARRASHEPSMRAAHHAATTRTHWSSTRSHAGATTSEDAAD
jgi:glycosyltransferase involved in cell wall biosynthesis